MEKNDNSIFLDGLKQLNIQLSDNQIGQFEKYYDMLIETNKVMNLTSITEYQDVVIKHFLDSLSLVKMISFENRRMSILDMGTGAGFPGIPLKIAFPQLQITLMDSLNKRILFLQNVIEELSLSEICAIHERAEEAAGKVQYREKFDLCVSRAVARLNSLAEFCIPFVRKGGFFIPYKSGNINDEQKEAEFAIRELGGVIRGQECYTIPCSDIERTLIKIEKKATTPKKYPRAGGRPLKQPLIAK